MCCDDRRISMTHAHDRARRSALRTIGGVAIVALLDVVCSMPAPGARCGPFGWGSTRRP